MVVEMGYGSQQLEVGIMRVQMGMVSHTNEIMIMKEK